EVLPSETCVAPAAGGSYVISGIPLGEVRIEFIPSVRSGLLKQYYDHVAQLREASDIVLSEQKPVGRGIDAMLAEAGSIESLVTAAGGAGRLPEVEVCAIPEGALYATGCAETNGDGVYRIQGLSPGSYDLHFRGAGRSAAYEPAQQPVSVAAGSTVSAD